MGDTLRMETTRPGDAPELLRDGWPALVANLRVVDADGREVPTRSAGAAGWVLGPHGERITAEYEVDYAPLARQGWPAPREAAYLDDSALLVVARSVFVGHDAPGAATVRFVAPAGWQVAAPWIREGDGFRARSFAQLTTNAFALTRTQLSTTAAGGFVLQSLPFGGWRARDAEITGVLCAAAATFTGLFGGGERHGYLAAFLEAEEMAGEAYLDSYAMQADPRTDRASWARIVAHELFHYWNGQRLRGADYTASQWFQEGVTEYYALLASARSGFMDEAELLRQLSGRLGASRGMTASLVESGNRKNAAFYGRATITALLLDLTIRERSGGRRSLDDVLRAMWWQFGQTDRPYALAELYSTVTGIAGADAAAFLRSQVETAAPVEVHALLRTVGLESASYATGAESITADPTAGPAARTRWLSMISPRADRSCPGSRRE
ncbi:MAG TPA: hypothetical protein VFQ45_20370 [Longimicrobium sp.]|nr:hypothetical protein [Longimicrobium sp.]